MIFTMLLKTSCLSLLHHKGRSFLTMLGIIIGIAAIIVLLAIGRGAEKRIEKEIMAWGNHSIAIWPFTPPTLTYQKKIKPNKPLMFEDADVLRQRCPKINYITPFASLHRQPIKYLSQTPLNTEIKGGNEELLAVLGRKLLAGSDIQKHHLQKNARVIILGYSAAKTLFKNSNPIGKVVIISNVAFTVTGVLEEMKTQAGNGWQDANQDVFIPITTLKKYLEKSNNRYAHQLCLTAITPQENAEVAKEITKILRARHKLTYDDVNDFTIFDQDALAQAAKASSAIFTFFLFVVALIALLIGGIGVMNIMLVSVGERTKEIGIRMAIGAQPSIVLQQFLLESIILCAIGGFIGICIGCIAPSIIGKLAGIPGIITATSIVIAFLTIFFIGILFGYYPARKAAQLNPIEALQEH